MTDRDLTVQAKEPFPLQDASVSVHHNRKQAGMPVTGRANYCQQPPVGNEGSSPLTLTDFRLVAELGRVLLFSWEELELFSSSSSSSSKLMLLEMPAVSREQQG